MNTELPVQFTEKMKSLLGEEYPGFLKSFKLSARKSFRISELKTTKDQFQAKAPFQMEPFSWAENGFYYNHTDGVSVHPYYRAGVYYITEASAMAPAELLPVDPGDHVLDLCAAPGGKAFALIGKLGKTGLIVANEVNSTRSKALLYNLETTGCPEMIITNEQPAKLAEKFPGYFDKILVDAPCSGEGMFRKDRTAAKEWSAEKVSRLAALQKSILSSAAAMLKPGGMLMYSTCTFSPEENEQNVSWLLDEYPMMKILNPEAPGAFARGRSDWAGNDLRVENARRIWPHQMEAEGQFMALFQKDPKAEIPDLVLKKQGKGKKERKRKSVLTREERFAFEKFCENMTMPMDPKRLEVSGRLLFLLPKECPDTEGICVLRKGLLLGELKKDRFEPSQSLAFALSEECYRFCLNLSSSDERIQKYLKGEPIEWSEEERNTEKGWVLILCDGYPLGFGKAAGATIKNKLLYSRRII